MHALTLSTALLAASLLSPPSAVPAAPGPAPAAPTGQDAPTAVRDSFLADAQDLQPLLVPIAEKHGVPGMAVAVVSVEGTSRIVGLGGVGVLEAPRAADADAKVTATSVWHLGSCTKAFTATLCAVLVDEGKLRWDTTIGDLLGPQVSTMHADWRGVTVEELLRHEGGAPKSPTPSAWRGAWLCTDDPATCRRAFLTHILAEQPAQPRGTFTYSNQGYALAGWMCEVAGGASWERLVRERVCDPLGITSLGFGVPSTTAPTHATKGHNPKGEVTNIDNPQAIAPAGTMHMTLVDWARFIAFHTRKEPTPTLGLTQATFERLHRIPDGSTSKSALGFFGGTRSWGGAVLTHSGSNTSWFCVTWITQSKQFAVLVTCNQGGPAAERACDQAAAAAIEWWTNRTSKPSP